MRRSRSALPWTAEYLGPVVGEDHRDGRGLQPQRLDQLAFHEVGPQVDLHTLEYFPVGTHHHSRAARVEPHLDGIWALTPSLGEVNAFSRFGNGRNLSTEPRR